MLLGEEAVHVRWVDDDDDGGGGRGDLEGCCDGVGDDADLAAVALVGGVVVAEGRGAGGAGAAQWQ